MLLLADSADRDTGTCYPGIKTLARLMRSTERTVQRTLRTLTESGELAVKRQSSPFGTNLYTISRDILGGDKNVALHAQQTDNIPQGGTDLSGGGDENVTPLVTEMSPKPLVEQEIDKSISKRKKILPENWLPTAEEIEYAKERGIADIPALVEDFKSYYLAHGKAMLDWHLTFLRWVRNARTFKPHTNGHVPEREYINARAIGSSGKSLIEERYGPVPDDEL
jgi:hypothetical protein